MPCSAPWEMEQVENVDWIWYHIFIFLSFVWDEAIFPWKKKSLGFTISFSF